MYRYLFSRFFSAIQESRWYSDFFASVINEIPSKSTILDVGTGSGKLSQLLEQEDSINCTGLDTSESMLIEARKKLADTHAKLIKIEKEEPFPLPDEAFDIVAICNVLFNLTQEIGEGILIESLRVLKPEGKILILSPTGKGSTWEITRRIRSLGDIGIFIWYYSTQTRGGRWLRNNYLPEYCTSRNLTYTKRDVFAGLGQLELIRKE